jgi:hypothetical protein
MAYCKHCQKTQTKDELLFCDPCYSLLIGKVPAKEHETPANVEYSTGATASEMEADWNLLDWKVLRRMAVVMTEGAIKHGYNNWHKGLPERVVFAHTIEHVVQGFNGNTDEDHLIHAMCRLMMRASDKWVPDIEG